jgi:ABC-2 type transport system ATP-binding protein
MKTVITVTKLCKHFKVPKHYRGRFAALRNLFTRQYTLVKAVDEVSFRVRRGELVGYLGPNGAGKSTTIKMLSGLLTPTSGELRVNGYVPWRERKDYVAKIGAVFGQRTSLWWDLPVIESLDMLRYIYKIPTGLFHSNLNEFRKLLELTPFINTPVRSLSLGQRMRADICAALLHNPEILFLDEPTIGLDVVAKERIRQFILHINQQHGTTVILTTHDLSDIEKLCQRVMIIDKGSLLYDGSLDRIKERFGGKRQLLVEFSETYTDAKIQGAQIVEQLGQHVTYQFERDEITASELIGRISARYRIRDLQVREPDIEATIRRIYEERLLERDNHGGNR